MTTKSVSDFLLEKSCDLVTFSKFQGCKGRIIEVDMSGQPKEFTSRVTSLEDQLNLLSDETRHSDTSKGWLHLLLHQCTKDEAEAASLPFKDLKSFNTMIDKLNLPKCYPYDYGRRQPIPAMVTYSLDGFEVVCHTPKFPTTWVSLALRYNYKSRTTFCFLIVAGQMGRLVLEVVNSLRSLASHPLLLPIALYWATSQMLRHDNQDVDEAMIRVQHDTGLLEQYLKVDVSTKVERRDAASSSQNTPTPNQKAPAPNQNAPTLNQIHKGIVKQHAVLTRGLAEFTEELGASCLSALDRIGKMGKRGRDEGPQWLDEAAHSDLWKLFKHAEISTDYELRHRQRLLGRVKIQQQVLYSLMQSRIGDEALRDSRTMKSIAILTMVFLPTTALSTMFSMGAFFSTDPDDGHVVVSHEFWLFWALAAPITLLVLLTFFIWEHRAWVRKHWHREKGPDVEALTGQIGGNDPVRAAQTPDTHISGKAFE